MRRLRNYHSDSVVLEARYLKNPAQAERSGVCCGVERLSNLVRACRRYATVLLLTLLLAAGEFTNRAYAQADSCAVNVIHTYMNGRPIQWDSVKVRVCIPPCERPYHYRDFMLYWPDTLLTNCTTGTEEYILDKEVGLSQNFPNPCQGESSVKLTTQTAGNVNLQITDIQGRLCCQRSLFLPAGEHLLSLNLPASGIYFVQAQTKGGNEVCKVLCSEGSGSDYDINVASSSCQFAEKADKGGEGQFNMTNELVIIAYITYNGEVKRFHRVVNRTEEVDGYIFDDWMYHYGSINIFFRQEDTTSNITLSGKTFRVIVGSQTCLPFTEYPVSYSVTFSDSTFYSEPEACAEYSSSTWHFNGWYKYRYYCDGESGLCICSMDETLPPEDIPSLHCGATAHCYIRHLDALFGGNMVLSKFSPVWGNYDEEWIIVTE